MKNYRSDKLAKLKLIEKTALYSCYITMSTFIFTIFHIDSDFGFLESIIISVILPPIFYLVFPRIIRFIDKVGANVNIA
jgi:hypothetical protein